MPDRSTPPPPDASASTAAASLPPSASPALPVAPRAGLAVLQAGGLALAGVLVAQQLHLAHGPAADPDGAGPQLSGVPAMVWATPLQVVALVLLRGTGAAGERGEAARGGLIAVLALLALAAAGLLGLGPDVGAAIVLTVQVLALALALGPAGLRRPRWPSVDDWLPAMLIGLTAVMGFGFWARIVAFQLDQQVERAQAEPSLSLPADAAVATQWREGAPVQVPGPRSPAPIDDQDPAVGPADAAVTVVSFLDLQDPASRRMAWMLTELEPRYQDRVRFVTKHLPMDAACNDKRRRTTHPRACAVAVALQCANAQRGFRGYRLQLLRNPHAVEEADLDAYAAALGLDVAAFAACRVGVEGPAAVEADVEQAGKGTMGDPPMVFVEGRVLDGSATLAQLEATLAVALGERTVDAQGMAPAMLPVLTQAGEPLGPVAMVAVGPQGAIPGGTFIDAVEGAVDGQGRAVAQVGAAPWVIDLDGARAACAVAGKRLCSREEWVTACQGTAAVDDDGDGELFEDRREGRLRPYGDPWREGWCQDQGSPGLAGAAPACRTPEGALDMAGNLAEWVEEGLLLGGAAGDGEAAGCHAAVTPAGPGWRGRGAGFRCCADAAPAPSAEAPSLPAVPPVLPAPALAAATLQALGGGPVVVVPWRVDCAPCQQALLGAVSAAGSVGAAGSGGAPRVLALSVQEDVAGAREWLARGGVSISSVDDPQARLAGALGVPGLPWVAAYDAGGNLVGAWEQAPPAEALRQALAGP